MEITKLLTNEKALELAEKLLQNDKDIRDKLDTDKADLIYVQDNLKSLDHDISELSSVTNNALESIDRDMIREQDRVNTELDKKVDKVDGKGLSTNDYTTDEKTKLEGLSNYDDSAIKNTIDQNTKNIATKLDKNQGTSNAGKITGINESGDIVPMFPQGITYNEETQCLEYGVDEKLNLNAGIQLDDTLSKSGYAADASKVGELKGDIVTLTTATVNDIGKVHVPKTVSDGKVTEWEYKDITQGGGGCAESELLVDITTDEDLASLNINLGSYIKNPTTFISFPYGTNRPFKLGYFEIYRDDVLLSSLSTTTNSITDTNTYNYVIHCDSAVGMSIVEQFLYGTDSKTRKFNENFTKESLNKIVLNYVTLPAGTMIKVYGVRV